MGRSGGRGHGAVDAARGPRDRRRADPQGRVAGLEPENVDISLSGDVLTISGQKSEERKEEKARFHLSERRYGSFQRSLSIPIPVEPESVNAEMKNGLLTITLKKSEAVRPKKISGKGS